MPVCGRVDEKNCSILIWLNQQSDPTSSIRPNQNDPVTQERLQSLKTNSSIQYLSAGDGFSVQVPGVAYDSDGLGPLGHLTTNNTQPESSLNDANGLVMEFACANYWFPDLPVTTQTLSFEFLFWPFLAGQNEKSE